MTKDITTALQTIIAATGVDQRITALEQSMIAITKRLDAQGDRVKRAATITKDKLTTKEAAAIVDVCPSAFSMLVSAGHITPANPDAPNGAPHKFDPAHIRNFVANNSSGEITRMISEYRHRPRKPRMKRVS